MINTSHHQYSTIKSICDVLEELGVEYYPLKYSPDEIKLIKSPFIAHLNLGGGSAAGKSNKRNLSL